MNNKATTVELTPVSGDPLSLSDRVFGEQLIREHKETRDIGVALQRAALRLAELGHVKAASEVLRAAVRLGRVKPGQKA